MASAIKNLITETERLAKVVGQLRSESKTIGVVPTMGALHEGHLSLVRSSLEQADETIVTIFVNPIQFAAGEDLDHYPRPIEADLEKLAAEGVEYVFAPGNDQIYPAGFSTTINPPAISQKLEGEFRPSHFRGVTTVVLKLLNLTRADLAFFGQKDFQQQLVVRKMVEDLNVPARIVVCNIVREPDGLAMSSRNAYLSSEQRQIALSLNRTLKHVESEIRSGNRDGFELISQMRQMMIDAGVSRVDYAALADPETLEITEQVESTVVALVAAHVGSTRLIDNLIVEV